MTFLGSLRILVMSPVAAIAIVLTGPAKWRFMRLGSLLSLALMALAIRALRWVGTALDWLVSVAVKLDLAIEPYPALAPLRRAIRALLR